MKHETIGRYKLLQEIGEGGFGVVYQAEQTEPVRRTVALKVLKAGMDTRQVVARFEAERQALAIMDHPNIAKVLDAGATDNGRPYFVMELVRGIPITEYCDQAKLDTVARLGLFQQVCHAIQHAHQKGIIHRDLKPSNILVAHHDGKPVPKVIDFGIAKATDHRLTEKTLFTEFRQMIGTPEYMAPEQAEMSGLDVDTRADIYSLGILLYELLTGTKPFDLRALLDKGYEEMLRNIREVDPPKPSTRVSTMGDQLPVVAARRHIPPRLLGTLLRGDLDWIVMKAIEKDRSRRYESANGLALDIQHYLDDEPVSAARPGALYRARKYVRRHRLGVAAASIVTVALLVGVILSFAGYAEAAERRNRARLAREAAARDAQAAELARKQEAEQAALAESREKDARTKAKTAKTALDFVQDLLGSADPREVKGRNYTVRQLLDDFDRDLGTQLEDEPEVEAVVRSTLGTAYLNLGLHEKAEPHLTRALELSRGLGDELLADALNASGTLHLAREDYDVAEDLFRQGLELSRELHGARSPALGPFLSNLANALEIKGDYAAAEKLLRQALEITPSDEHGAILHNLAKVLHAQGKLDAAEELHRKVLKIKRRIYGEKHPHIAHGLMELGRVLRAKHDLDGAEKLFREALEMRREMFGNEHAEVAQSLNDAALTLREKGDPDGAEKLLGEALAIARAVFGEEHLEVATVLGNLALLRKDRGDMAGAEKFHRESLKIKREWFGNEHADVATELDNLGIVLQRKGDNEAAEKCHREALGIFRKALGNKHQDVAVCLSNLGQSIRARDPAAAEKVYREAIAIEVEIGREHPSSLLNLSGLLSARGDFDAAIELQRKAVALSKKLFGEKHFRTVGSRGALAMTLVTKGDYAAAEVVAREMLAAHRSDSILALLGLCLLKQDKFADAEPVARECLAIRAKNVPGSWLHYNAMSMLGGALAGQGKYADAEKLLIEGYEKMRPPPPAAVRKREALQRIVALYEAWKQPEKAAEWRAKAGGG